MYYEVPGYRSCTWIPTESYPNLGTLSLLMLHQVDDFMPYILGHMFELNSNSAAVIYHNDDTRPYIKGYSWQNHDDLDGMQLPNCFNRTFIDIVFIQAIIS